MQHSWQIMSLYLAVLLLTRKVMKYMYEQWNSKLLFSPNEFQKWFSSIFRSFWMKNYLLFWEDKHVMSLDIIILWYHYKVIIVKSRDPKPLYIGQVLHWNWCYHLNYAMSYTRTCTSTCIFYCSIILVSTYTCKLW